MVSEDGIWGKSLGGCDGYDAAGSRGRRGSRAAVRVRSLVRHEGQAVKLTSARVYGTKKLHVVDAGILPFQVTAHMMSTLYAVAARAADVIAEGIY